MSNGVCVSYIFSLFAQSDHRLRIKYSIKPLYISDQIADCQEMCRLETFLHTSDTSKSLSSFKTNRDTEKGINPKQVESSDGTSKVAPQTTLISHLPTRCREQ